MTERRSSTARPLLSLVALGWATLLLAIACSDLLGPVEDSLDLVATALLAWTPLVILALPLRRSPVGVAVGAAAIVSVLCAGVLMIPPSRGSMMMGPVHAIDVARMPGTLLVEVVGGITGDHEDRQRARWSRAVKRDDPGPLVSAPLEALNHYTFVHGSLLAEAAHHGSLEVLAHLVERGAELGPRSQVLSGAATGGDPEIARWLLGHGADPVLPVANCGGAGPHVPHPHQLAVEAGHDEIAVLLFDAGIARWGDAYVSAMLEHAVCWQLPALVDVAVAHGADPTSPTRKGRRLLELAVIRAWLDPSQERLQERRDVHLESVRALIALGLDPEAPNAEGRSARELADEKGVLWLFDEA